MTLRQKMQRARSLHAQWVLAADAVMVELQRLSGSYECDIPAIRKIQETVADAYQLPVMAMVSPIRSNAIAQARQVAMALSRELTAHSLEQVGRCFGGRDHGTVIHAEQRVKSRLEVEPAFARTFEAIRSACIAALGPKFKAAA